MGTETHGMQRVIWVEMQSSIKTESQANRETATRQETDVQKDYKM
jgi:hypothetical protein